jgi:LmbE family N-acetylglucosaminyl deacetylase
MNILVLAPHPDDECIGCGGTVARHVERGDEVTTVFLTSGELGLKKLPREIAWQTREAEARAACRILGITRSVFLRLPDWMIGDDVSAAANELRPILEQMRPGLAYLPHPMEWHPDHRATLPILKTAYTGLSLSAPVLRGYEVWTPLPEYQHVENIDGTMEKKLDALRAHASQIADWDYVRAIRGLNAFRGVMAGRCEYAEVFQDLSLDS